jgi:S1-C subfamily serine protease
MNPDPSQPVGPAPAPGPDPLDETQPLEVPRFAPTPDPRPDTRWAWASPDARPAAERWYEPAPAEPASGGVPWASGATATGTGPFAPADDPQPAYAAGGPVRPVPPRRRSGPGIGTIVTASLLSALLASGGTVLVLGQSGAFDRPAPVATPGTGQQTGGQQPAGQPSSVDESSAVITSAAKVSPAVVKITTTGQANDPFGTSGTEGVGSGIIYDAGGWIVTNRHVVTGADKLTVELKDGRQFDGKVYGVDTFTDLAIIKVDATGLPTATIGSSDELKVGQLVVAVGSPLGTYSFSVTSGIVSGKGREIQVSDGASGSSRITNLIQTDAAINPGNSGGPLADASGTVVGIDTAVATDSSGIGFAIPIDIAKPIMAQAVRGDTLARPWIGIRFQSLNLQLQATLKLSVSSGALITTNGGTAPAIQPDSPALKAGLKEGDVITAINGTAIDQEHPLDAMLVQFSPNDTIQLSVLRGGATIKVPLTLGIRPSGLQ